MIHRIVIDYGKETEKQQDSFLCAAYPVEIFSRKNRFFGLAVRSRERKSTCIAFRRTASEICFLYTNRSFTEKFSLNMKKITLFFFLALSTLLTGCFNILEEVTLNQDGSGLYSLKMDLSAILADDFMKSMIQQNAGENEATKDLANNLEKDTMIFLKDLPMEAKAKTGKPEFWNNVQMQVKISDKTDEFFTDIKLRFKTADDIAFFYKHLSTVMEEAGTANPGMNPTDMLPAGATFKAGKKSFTRLPANTAAKSELEGQDMEMMKMFLSNAKFTTIYNMPGRVKKVTIPGAEITGNSVKVVASLIDLMDGKAKLEGDIKYK